MRFLCIGYFDPAKMDALPQAECDALMQQCPAHMDTLYATGKVALVAGVENRFRYLRRTGDGVAVSEHRAGGTEGRVIGCVFILEAADMDEAVKLAALHPTTQVPGGERLGWYTEVRPVHYFHDGGSQDSR